MDWLEIPNIELYAVLGILFLFGAIEFALGHYKNTSRRKDDWVLEALGLGVVQGTKMLLILIVYFAGDFFFPLLFNSLSHWSLLLSFPVYIFIDDLAQYWYHRSAHEYNWLWKHHRVHHAAESMGILTSYRNSWVYYLLMPNIWWLAIATFLGWAPAVILSLIFKQFIVTTSHSTWKWDEVLYKYTALHPIAWLIEHILITPAFHNAHHGKAQNDHISDPNGNFGNTFSFWDQMFRTAKFTRKFPLNYGLQSNSYDSWTSQLLYPFVKESNEPSELHKHHKKVRTAGNEPFKAQLQEGTYLYCQCGYSRNQPFCSGAHHGPKNKPLVFEVQKSKKVSLCTCKMTKSPPYCDNSHLTL